MFGFVARVAATTVIIYGVVRVLDYATEKGKEMMKKHDEKA